MNNPNICNPDTDYPRNLSEDEQGFNYGTYPTVEGRIKEENNLVPEGSYRGYAYLSTAVRGSVSQLSFKDNARKQARSANSGGTRGKIRGFSRVSRRNLLRRFASIKRTAFRAFEGKLLFVTLTYPTEYPKESDLCKKHLEAFGKRL